MLQLLGLLLPPLIDLLNRKITDSDIRFWISVSVCFVFGSVVALLTTALFDNMKVNEIVEAISMETIVMFGLAQLSYKGLWEKSAVRSNLGFKPESK